jgi:hypothetical protein
MKKRPEFRRPKIGRCIGINLVAAVAGTMSAGAFFLLVYGIGMATDTNLKTYAAIVGMVMALPAMLAGMYAMLELPLAQSLKLSVRPLVLMVVIGVPLGADALWRTRAQVRHEKRTARCINNLNALWHALVAYQHSYGDPAPDLQTLVDAGEAEQALLKCPGAPDREIGYFYVQVGVGGPDDSSRKIIVCDFAGNHPGKRNVLLSNGAAMTDTRADFAARLEHEQNRKFADALKAAEAD